MIKTLFTIALALVSTLTFAQNQSMSFSHFNGASPNELTVAPGEEIDFYWAGGQTHPMTEGWQTGEDSTPIPFQTVTVTSANTETANNPVSFTLDEAGTYYFHCGTNPGNTGLWASIIVKESGVGIEESESMIIGVYPNPAYDFLTINGFIGEASVYDMAGKLILIVTSPIVDITTLTKGIYILENQGEKTQFIKE
jgi:plastocyanin|tara:strand:- start:2468 stop:3055 length:588 start_codon:yes stop_codon:yes gene_type:complete